MEDFPKHLQEHFGDLISIWVLQYMGTQQGSTSEEAFAELLAPSLFNCGELAFRDFDSKLEAKKATDSSTSD